MINIINFTYDKVNDRIITKFTEWVQKTYLSSLDVADVLKLLDNGLDLFIEQVKKDFDMSYNDSDYDVEYAFNKLIYDNSLDLDIEGKRKVLGFREMIEGLEADFDILIENVDSSIVSDSYDIDKLKVWLGLNNFNKSTCKTIIDIFEDAETYLTEAIQDYGDVDKLKEQYKNNSDWFLVEVTPYGSDTNMMIAFNRDSMRLLKSYKKIYA